MRSFRRFVPLVALLCSVAFVVTLLCGAIWALGTNAQVMLTIMQRTAPPESTHLPEEYYPQAVSTIVEYLTGAADEFQFTFSMDGAYYAAFRTNEQVHMADCRALFFLCRRVGILSGAFAACFFCYLLLMPGGMRRFARSLRHVALFLLLLSLVAALCFTDAFVLFHRIFFRNDLWLLDPHTNLLIRLMPTAFFEHYAVLLLLALLLGLLAGEGLAFLLNRLLPTQRKKVLP